MKLITISFLLLTSILLNGQNLVPNPSFEDKTACPNILSLIHYATGWERYCAETPDYYNECSTGNFTSVPNNYGGFQYASTGGAYAGIATYSKSIPNYRDIIGRNLTTQLTIGVKYYLSMQVNLSIGSLDSSSHATNNFGMLLSTVPYSNTSPAPIGNFAHFNYETVVTDTMNWTRVSGSFIADSTYGYIAIGNFFTDANTDTTQILVGNVTDPFSYYFIDDVCVSQDSLSCYNFTSVQQFKNLENINIYPNPSNGKITISLEKEAEVSIIIRNIIGKIIFQDKFYSSKIFDLSLNSPAGLYFLTLETDGEVVSKKIIKQ